MTKSINESRCLSYRRKQRWYTVSLLIEYNLSFDKFKATALAEIERNNHGLLPEVLNQTCNYSFSAIPCLISHPSHARSYTIPDSCQKISFGKMMVSDTGQKNNVHVCSCTSRFDGWHLGQFVDYFQEIMNQQKTRLKISKGQKSSSILLALVLKFNFYKIPLCFQHFILYINIHYQKDIVFPC
jgi:chloramphenicol O-acetyltransferase